MLSINQSINFYWQKTRQNSKAYWIALHNQGENQLTADIVFVRFSWTITKNSKYSGKKMDVSKLSNIIGIYSTHSAIRMHMAAHYYNPGEHHRALTVLTWENTKTSHWRPSSPSFFCLCQAKGFLFLYHPDRARKKPTHESRPGWAGPRPQVQRAVTRPNPNIPKSVNVEFKMNWICSWLTFSARWWGGWSRSRYQVGWVGVMGVLR